tara:strand:+ start:134625 stop:135089 length:465 start_codon:yes stop_codon:yes gene_type:complete
MTEHRLINAAVFIGTEVYLEARNTFMDYQRRIEYMEGMGNVTQENLQAVIAEAHTSAQQVAHNALLNIRIATPWSEVGATIHNTDGDSITLHIGLDQFRVTLCIRYSVGMHDKSPMNSPLVFFNVYRNGQCMWSMPRNFGDDLSFAHILQLTGI